MLRAVLSLDLLKLHASCYVGQEFPVSTLDSAADFAVLRIFDEEPNEGSRVGFQRFDTELGRIDDTVRACTTKLGPGRARWRGHGRAGREILGGSRRLRG
jgi:hypothetical protein